MELPTDWQNMGGRVWHNTVTSETLTLPLKNELAGSAGFERDRFNKQTWTNAGPVYPEGLGAQSAILVGDSFKDVFPDVAPAERFTMIVGQQGNKRGYSVGGAFGSLDPLNLGGLAVQEWTQDPATNIGLFFFGNNVQIPGITIIRCNVITDGFGAVNDYVWNGVLYENLDAAFSSFLNGKIALPVEIDVTQVP